MGFEKNNINIIRENYDGQGHCTFPEIVINGSHNGKILIFCRIIIIKIIKQRKGRENERSL